MRVPRLLKAGAVPTGVILALGLSSCTSGGPATETTDPVGVTQSPVTSAEPSPKSPSTPIQLEVNGKQIKGQLDDNATSRSLIAQLPLTLTFDDHGGQEKYADLSTPLDLTGAPARSDAEPLTIGYYSPDQRLILYYEHVQRFAGIIPLGRYDDDTGIRDRSGPFTLTISAAT